MSNAAGDGGGGGGGGGAAVELEFSSIEAAISRVKDISDRIGTLEGSFKGFAGGVSSSDWSEESSCVQFGSSYKAAVTVYADVISGMKADLARYSEALQSAWNEYKTSDDNSAGALAKLGQVDDKPLSQDAQGQGTYHDAPNHKVLSSDDPNQATDTTPNDSSTTTLPGDSSASGAGNGGAGQTTQNAGTSQGGPNGGNGGTPANGGAGQSTQPTGGSSGGQR